eukprot:5782133-Lingulodinium_polyedra.AAC.1
MRQHRPLANKTRRNRLSNRPAPPRSNSEHNSLRTGNHAVKTRSRARCLAEPPAARAGQGA